VNYRRPATAIKSGVFNEAKDVTIYVRERIDDELYGILIYNREASNFPATINAAHGTIELFDGGNGMKATLYNGQMQERDDKNKDIFNIRTFKKLVMNMPDLGYRMKNVESDYRGDRELNVEAMEEIIAGHKGKIQKVNTQIDSISTVISELENQETLNEKENQQLNRLQNSRRIKNEKLGNYEKKIRIYEVEIHKKYALAFACLIFVLIGAPVGMMTKSNGVGMAFTVSSFVFMIYYGALTGGEELADKGLVAPWLSMWISNIILGLIGIYLIVISVREMKIYDLNLFWHKMLSKFRRNKNASA